MEPLFGTTRVMTEKYAREIFRNTSCIYHLFYLLFMLFSLSYVIYWVYWYYEINVTFLMLFMFELIAYICRPYTVGRNRIKEYNTLYNAPETDEYLFYEEFFVNKDLYSKSEIKVEYSKISSVKTTKNFYIFSIKDSKTKIALLKNADDDSQKPEFIEFINGKIVNSKRKIK